MDIAIVNSATAKTSARRHLRFASIHSDCALSRCIPALPYNTNSIRDLLPVSVERRVRSSESRVMQSPPVKSGAKADSSSSESPVDRKRKRGFRRQTSTNTAGISTEPKTTTAISSDSTTSTGKQKTIQDLFSTKTKAGLEHNSPSNKRAKYQTPPRASAQDQPPRAMYSFPSKYDNKKSGFVDLTKQSRPRKPFVNPLDPNATELPFHPGAGAKKLVVKNLKPQTSWDSNKYFNDTWQQLSSATDAVLSGAPVNFSMEEMYRGVENLCRQGRAKDLYRKLANKCESHITRVVKPGLLSKNRSRNVDVLQDVLSAWASWQSQVVSCPAPELLPMY